MRELILCGAHKVAKILLGHVSRLPVRPLEPSPSIGEKMKMSI